MGNWVMKDDCLVVTVPRELDHFVASNIREETDCLFEKAMIKYVVFDFSKTTFMDSSGIGLIMGRYRQVLRRKGNVYVYGVTENVDKIFMLSGLYKVVKKTNVIVGEEK